MKKVFINGIILDGTKNMIPMHDQMIVVEDGKIVDICQQKEIEGYEIIDAKGQYILPGLINMHVHIPATGKPKKKQSDVKKLVALITSNALTNALGMKLCESYVKNELYSGVTTIRTVGGITNYDTKLRDKIQSGKAIGPRILASNMAVSVPGGHMAGSLAYEAKSPQEAAHYVEEICKDNVDWIKLMITGGVLDAKVKGEPGELKMPSEYVKAACDKAHELGKKVCAHVESTQGVLVALQNGVDSIEHGALPTKEIIDLFKEKHAFHVATFSPALPFAKMNRDITHISEEQQYNGEIVFNGILECAKSCLDNGIEVGLGTDTGCPYVTHYDMWRELYYYHMYCGVSNAFALYTATALNAKLSGVDSFTGTLEKGKFADIILCKDNPLEDLSALRELTSVYKEGIYYDPSQLKKYTNVEKELDAILESHKNRI